MANSIKDQLNETDTVSEIKLLLGQDKKTLFVIVEGEDDKSVFTSILSDNVIVLPSYSGKEGVDKIVKDHFPRNKRVIGIRDKDYLGKPVAARSFFCDYCCLEMMIIAIDSCYERLYNHMYKDSELDKESLLLFCFDHLEMLSKYRMLNEKKKWCINFSGIKPGKLFDKDITVMNSNILNDINDHNTDNPIGNTREKACYSLPKCSCLQDYLYITNGHDFIHLFQKVCNKRGSKYSVDDINTFLLGTFGENEFKHTLLYKNLLQYQEKAKISVLKNT